MAGNGVVLATLIFYKVVLVAIGVWAARRVKNEDDFFLGGRGLGPIVAGVSYSASSSSAWILLGFTGFVYAAGVSALWMLPGFWVGYAVLWLWLGKMLREESAAEGHVTLTDFLVARLQGRGRRLVAALAALLTAFCFIFYIAAQFDATAKAFMEEFGLGFTTSVLIGAVIIVVYSMMGGFWAVSVTDTLQGIVMILVALGLSLTAFFAAGGFQGIGEGLAGVPVTMDLFGGRTGFLALGFVLGTMSIGLGTFGQPHLVSRLMAVRDDAARRQGFVVAISWSIVISIAMAVLGLAGRVLTPEMADGESLFYALAGTLLPAVVAGVVIAAVLSAVMSTVDSILLAASGAIAHDLGLVRVFPNRAVLISRATMIGIAILAVALTLALPDTIFNRVLFAWAALGAAFGPIIFARTAGVEPPALAIGLSIVAGFAVTVLFYLLGAAPVNDGAGAMAALSRLAHLPGDPFERLVPWVLPLALLFFWPKSASSVSIKTRSVSS
ncbi:MAG: sodium/proline symporter [Pseudomonadota bacterium]